MITVDQPARIDIHTVPSSSAATIAQVVLAMVVGAIDDP
jgi:hypothetical protein